MVSALKYSWEVIFLNIFYKSYRNLIMREGSDAVSIMPVSILIIGERGQTILNIGGVRQCLTGLHLQDKF